MKMLWGKGKKGQVAFILLIVVALALVVYSLYHFVIFGRGIEFQSRELASIPAEVDFHSGYVFAEAKIIAREAIKSSGTSDKQKEKFMEIAGNLEKERKFVLESGNFFLEARSGNFKFEKISESVENVENTGAGTEENAVAGADKYKFEMTGLFVYSEKGVNSIRRNFDIKMEFDSGGNYLGVS